MSLDVTASTSGLDARDPETAAELAELVYASDNTPGIQRKRRGKGFVYVGPDGTRISSPQEIARINALAIPPAYVDVWISPDPDTHLQATGRDLRGRKQYRYHPRWAQIRDDAKYSNLVAFGEVLPLMRERIDADLRKRGLPKERVLASIVWMLENTMIRVGNPVYARDNKSFGLTTLRNRHVEADGPRLRLKFKGKSGKIWNLQLEDRRIVKIIRAVQELPGQSLFQYEEDGEPRFIRSEDVNRYIRNIAGGEFSSKHFRTWGATQTAAALLSQTPLPESRTATARVLNHAVDQVANRLGNTRAVCRKSYIHPAVVDAWLEGRLADEMSSVRQSIEAPIPGLDADETIGFLWLRDYSQSA